MGGWNNTQLNFCEYYDIKKDAWTEFASLNNQISDLSATVLNNKYIYVFGGNKGEKVDSIEQYDISEIAANWIIINCKLNQPMD